MSTSATGAGRVRRRAAIALALCAALTLCAGCGRKRPATRSAGSTRIVALSPAIAITLRDLGVEDRIVGRHGWDQALDPSIPVCGDQSGIDYETLMQVDPTDIITQFSPRDLPPKLMELAAARNWNVLNLPVLSWSELVQSVRTLERKFAPDEHLSDRLEHLDRPDSKLAAIGSVLLLVGEQPLAALGPGSFHHDLLRRLGVTPAIDSGGPYQELDAEDLVRLAPEAIIVLAPRTPGSDPGAKESAEEVAQRLGIARRTAIPAVRSGRLALIDDPFCLTPSTGLIRLFEDMQRVLEGWLPPG